MLKDSPGMVVSPVVDGLFRSLAGNSGCDAFYSLQDIIGTVAYIDYILIRLQVMHHMLILHFGYFPGKAI